MRLLWGITGSFCNHQAILQVLADLTKKHDIQTVVTSAVSHTDTRFFTAHEFLQQLTTITGKPVLHQLTEVEPLAHQYDLMVIAPMTATMMGKLTNGIYDCAVSMAAKVMLRNQYPIVCAISTNDALGNSGENLMRLYNRKQFYFVPFYQDAPLQKPNSITSAFHLLSETIQQAEAGKQIQPILYERGKADA